MRVSGQFWLWKGFTPTKSTKTHISKQKQRRQHFYVLKKHLRGKKSLIRLFAFLYFLCAFCTFYEWNKKDSIFICIRTSKRKKIAYLTCCAFCTFYAFYVYKKHLRGRKLLVCILCFWCEWNLLVKK